MKVKGNTAHLNEKIEQVSSASCIVVWNHCARKRSVLFAPDCRPDESRYVFGDSCGLTNRDFTDSDTRKE